MLGTETRREWPGLLGHVLIVQSKISKYFTDVTLAHMDGITEDVFVASKCSQAFNSVESQKILVRRALFACKNLKLCSDNIANETVFHIVHWSIFVLRPLGHGQVRETWDGFPGFMGPIWDPTRSELQRHTWKTLQP